MEPLTEKYFDLFQKYLGMISGTEEAFEYIIASFSDFSKTEGDLILSDIFQALERISQTNILLERLLVDDEVVMQAIYEFQDVTAAALKLDGNFNNYDIKMNVVKNSLYPAFSAWCEIVNNVLGKYVRQ